MKKEHFLILLLITILSFNNSIKAQDCKGYEISISNKSVSKEEFLAAFLKFDYEKYRPKYLDYLMQFNNGITVKLIAADKLKKTGCTYTEKTDYPALEFLQKNISYFQYNTKQGTIMAAYNSIDSKE